MPWLPIRHPLPRRATRRSSNSTCQPTFRSTGSYSCREQHRPTSVATSPLRSGPSSAAPGDSAEPPAPVTSSGNLLRVHILQNDHHIDQENLAIDAPRATFDSTSKWTISIDNGDNAPLVPSSVRLQMLKRVLCFESGSGDYTLYYGDEKLSPPRYDLGQFLCGNSDAAQAAAGQEQPNPEYQPRPDDRPFTEKHPLLLWFALALVIAVLGAIAFRTARTTGPLPG